MKSNDLNALPEPLTPADCNLKDFAFMPLDVARLRDSDMASEQTPEQNWAAVLLWAAAWHQIPAGSMPDSDSWIAKAAGYMSRGRVDPHWKNVKAGAMRGFILCSDGRWYHQVVAEKANESWIGKLKQRLKTECARIKKHNDRHGTAIPYPEFDAWFAAGCPTGQPLSVPRDKPPMSLGTALDVLGDTPPLSLAGLSDVPPFEPSKGQGEGQGELTSKPESSSQASTGVGAEQQRYDDDLAVRIQRSTSIAALLSENGIEGTPDHAIVRSWAADSRMNRELLTEAITKARKSNSKRPMPLTYLEATVLTLLERQATPPRASTLPTAAPITVPQTRKPQGMDPKGIDESIEHYNARVAAAEAAQRRGQQP